MRPVMGQPGVRPFMRPVMSGAPGASPQFRPSPAPGMPTQVRPISSPQQANLVAPMQNMNIQSSPNMVMPIILESFNLYHVF